MTRRKKVPATYDPPPDAAPVAYPVTYTAVCTECGKAERDWPTPECVFCAQRAAWGYVDARRPMPDQEARDGV